MSFGLGTKRKGEGRAITIVLPEELLDRVNLLCVDPSTRKPVYGLRSQIISELLSRWAGEQEARIKQSAKELVA